MKRARARSVALLWALGQCAVGQEPAEVVDGDLGRAIDRAVQRTTSGGFWGAVLVAREGRVILARGYGNADYGATPNTSRSLFEIASLSKQFTATAILRLESQGRLRTDDTLEKFFRDVPADKRRITVGHLVTHTSGISPDIGLPYASEATRDETIAHALAPPLVSAPGEAFAYCNVGYALLAAIVESASERPFERVLEEELFAPAGMSDTGFIGDVDLDRERITTRLADASEDWTAADWFWGWGYRGMGGVVTTAWDLLAWDRALRGDEILDPDARTKLVTPVADGYAYGWMVSPADDGSTRVEHGGGVAGYGCQMTRWLERDAVVIVLSNGETDVRAVEGAIRDLLFPKPSLIAEIDVSPYELSEFQAVSIEKGLAWSVSRDASAGLVLRLEDTAKSHTLATVKMPPGTERALAVKLRAAIEGGQDDEAAKIAPMEGGAYLGPYDVSTRRLEISRTIELVCLSRYEGIGADGQPVVDRRVVLLLADSARSQWPIMTLMNRTEARALVELLERGLSGKK